LIKEEYKYSELTSKIIGCAMTVYSESGKKIAHKLKEMNSGKRLGCTKKQYT